MVGFVKLDRDYHVTREAIRRSQLGRMLRDTKLYYSMIKLSRNFLLFFIMSFEEEEKKSTIRNTRTVSVLKAECLACDIRRPLQFAKQNKLRNFNCFIHFFLYIY